MGKLSSEDMIELASRATLAEKIIHEMLEMEGGEAIQKWADDNRKAVDRASLINKIVDDILIEIEPTKEFKSLGKSFKEEWTIMWRAFLLAKTLEVFDRKETSEFEKKLSEKGKEVIKKLVEAHEDEQSSNQ